MPNKVQRIGDFEFDTLRGNVQRRAARITVIQRPGVGTGTRDDGLFSEPFSIQTERFVTDDEAANELYDDYNQLPRFGPVVVVWNSQAITPRYKVLAVSFADLRAIANVAGSIQQNPPPRALLVCNWRLLQMDA